MADDSSIIEGTVKFRDGKKWKPRWCVMRKLSPVADCVQLQLYGEARARWSGAASKAALSLDGYLGCEAGFTLDKHSHTLALICRDHTAVLAFETRERLIQWQVKLQAQVRGARQWLVVVDRGGRLAAGPARLLLRAPYAALVAGVPPRLLAVWELSHLRRYGAAQGRFCVEGGARCGRGAGLHVLVTDQAAEIAREFDCVSRGNLSPTRWFAVCRKNEGSGSALPQTVADAERARPPGELRLHDDSCTEASGAVSPYWPFAERAHFQDMGLGDTASVCEADGAAGEGGSAGEGGAAWGGAQLQRCRSCMSKLGALSRSSTAALTPGAKHFSPAWTMDALKENVQSYNVQNDNFTSDNTKSCEAFPVVNKTEEVCRCADRPPRRPVKPTRLELVASGAPAAAAAPLCARSHSHSHLTAFSENGSNKIGPYENYDVPKVPSTEIDGEYYDTPKRLKECLNRELFKITRSSTTNTLVLKKPCGCLLKLGKKTKEPTIVDCDENFEAASCPCRRVTDWAHAWIRLPYCRRERDVAEKSVPNKENSAPSEDPSALYATVDLSRKTRRKTQLERCSTDENLSCDAEIDDGPLANYENLSFALSLEHYENAKDLLRKVGITQSELDAIGANLKPFSLADISDNNVCLKCGHRQPDLGLGGSCGAARGVGADEYLMMQPSSLDSDRLERDRTLAAGYTPMSPIGSFAFHTLKYPVKSTISRLLEEKSASNPALCPERANKVGAEEAGAACEVRAEEDGSKRGRGRRSSSVDSSRFLEDVEEFEGSVGSGASASSMETLRDSSRSRARAQCACVARGTGARGGARGGAAGGGARDSCSSNDSGVSSWSLRSAAPPRAPPRPAALPPGEPRGVTDAHSTSSGTSDMSDYAETLSLCSSQSSGDAPPPPGPCPRRAASTLRPRAGREYRPPGPLAPAAPPAAPAPARQHRAGVARAAPSSHNETLAEFRNKLY